MSRYFWHIFIALTQMLNTLLGGWPDETTSSRVYRLEARGMRRAALARRLIDRLFFWQPHHCESAYESERRRYQFPPVLR